MDLISSMVAGTSATISWLLSDARSKARIAYVETRLNHLETNLEKAVEELTKSNLKIASGDQERLDFQRQLARLDSMKASRDLVDSIKTDLTNFRTDIDKRFDRIERLLEGKIL